MMRPEGVTAAAAPDAGWRDVWAPVLLGLVFFVYFTGGRIADPRYLDWILNAADPTQHFIGWNFFRNTTWLQWPLGLNPAYGEAISSSIVYSDSIPLLAIFFKLLAPILPANFQYFGLWVLACFVLQAVFGWLLMQRITPDRLLRVLGAGLLLVSPAMLYRIHAHAALVGHWVILAALWLYLHPAPKTLRWTLLLGMTVLIHAYLTAMVGAIWFADIARRAWCRKQGASGSVVALVREALVVPATVWVLAWAAGYFVLSGGTGAAGFGEFRMNLAAPVWPLELWSIFYVTEVKPGEYEGFGYMGAGMLGLAAIVAALYGSGRARTPVSRRQVVPLVLLGVSFLLFAASHRVGLGPRELFSYELPQRLLALASTFRASGRFWWPVLYMLELAILVLFVRAVSRRVAIGVMLALLALQVVEMRPAVNLFHDRWSKPWASRLQTDFWRDVPGRYQRIVFVLPSQFTPDYEPFAVLASQHGMTLAGGYFGRVDPARQEAMRQQVTQNMQAGRYRADTLYVFNDDGLWDEAVQRFHDHGFVGRVDGFRVFAPGYTGCTNACGLTPEW